MNEPDSHEAVGIDVRWTDEASKRLERAPLFLRGMVRRVAEKKARELGCAEITEDLLDQFKSQMMGGMGGESGMADAAEQMAQGHLPWTASAKERLNTVPEFTPHTTHHLTLELIQKVPCNLRAAQFPSLFLSQTANHATQKERRPF